MTSEVIAGLSLEDRKTLSVGEWTKSEHFEHTRTFYSPRLPNVSLFHHGRSPVGRVWNASYFLDGQERAFGGGATIDEALRELGDSISSEIQRLCAAYDKVDIERVRMHKADMLSWMAHRIEEEEGDR